MRLDCREVMVEGIVRDKRKRLTRQDATEEQEEKKVVTKEESLHTKQTGRATSSQTYTDQVKYNIIYAESCGLRAHA